MEFIKKIMICLLAFSSLSIMGISSDFQKPALFDTHANASLDTLSTDASTQTIKSTDAHVCPHEMLCQKIEQSTVDQSLAQNSFRCAQPCDLEAPQSCVPEKFKRRNHRYKNFHILISAYPECKIAQLDNHDFQTTLLPQ